MGITIKDVAEKAGVAPSTVSRVIHNNPKISRDTRDRVRLAMDELGYHPNAAARSLAKGKTQTLGLIIPDSEKNLFIKPFIMQAMRGLSIQARHCGYNILYSFVCSEEEEVESLEQFVSQNIVDGVILTTARDDDKSMVYLEKKRFPYVVIGRPDTKYTHALWVDNDNQKAMYDMVNHFLNKGLRRIAFMGGPLTYRVTRNRLEGYKKALKERGITPDETLIHLADDFQEADGFRGMEVLLSAGKPEAVAGADDYLIIGALSLLKQKGLFLPVSGFNNTAKGSFLSPALTTMDIQSEELGRKAADLLIGTLENENTPLRNYTVETRLIERLSSQVQPDNSGLSIP